MVTRMQPLHARLRGVVGALRQSTTPTHTEDAPTGSIPNLLGSLGATLLAASQATSDVEQTLERVAAAYGRTDIRIFVLPTLVLIEDLRASPAQTSIFPAVSATLRLDQAGAVDHAVRRALTEQPDPASVAAEIDAACSSSARFGAVLGIFGHTLLTVGFGLVLNPTASALPVYVILGVVVGAVVRFGSRFRTLSLILPVATAFVVTLLVEVLARPIVHDDVLRLVAPSLLSFLPGLTLTIAAVELTAGQVIAGASRMVYGIARLGLLAFGVYAGLLVAGEPTSVASSGDPLGGWAPWAGIALVSLGYYLYSTAPKHSLVWILYALLVAYAAQLLGHLLVGAELSGLIGALIVVPAVRLAALARAAPPPAVMLTCAYWLLVPGAMGFIGVTEAASGTAGASTAILSTFGSLLAIAIGMMLGAGLSRDAVAMARGWRVQPETKGRSVV